MIRGIRALGATTAVAALAAMGTEARAAVPIAGFQEVRVAAVNQGIAMDFAPDGRLFVGEKPGRLKSIRPDGTVRTVLDITGKVNYQIDRGLTGVAVDSQFASNRYVYLLYTYEPTGRNLSGPKTTRLTRIQVNPDDTVVNPSNPETIILGKHNPNLLQEACPAPSNTLDCIPADGTSHVGGTVRAAPDGTLFVGTGDAMHNATNAPDPFRPLNQASYAGKILHIDRNGRGVPGHRFCPTVTDLTQVCTKVFAMGFRNPFRFDFASRGGLYAGDVGQARWEELDHVVSGGSYGWPCYEGSERYAPRASAAQCQTLYSREGTAAAEKQPIYEYGHEPPAGAVIIGGPEYRADAYGAAYKDSVFFGDIDRGFLRRVELEDDGSAGPVHEFAGEFGGVDMRVGKDGFLYTANFYSITRFEPAAGNRPPRALATSDRMAGPLPLTVSFDGTGSSDPDGDALSYRWDFGDGSAPSTEAAPAHTFTAAGTFQVRLTVTDAGGLTDTSTIEIRSGLHPPQLDVLTPADGGLYRNGEPVVLRAQATDVEDGDLAAEVRWTIGLRHNSHTHSFDQLSGAETSFTPVTDHDADSHYEIQARVVDSDGLEATRSLRIDPETVLVELVTDPEGAAGMVSYGSDVFAWPVARRAAIGFRTTIVAPTTVTKDGQVLAFNYWSNGGPRTQELVIPATDLRLTAKYALDPWPPETSITSGPSVTRDKTPTFGFSASEPTSKVECRVDTQAWRQCWSPWTTPTLTNGQHVVEVRAYDWSGNVDATPARKTVIVSP